MMNTKSADKIRLAEIHKEIEFARKHKADVEIERRLQSKGTP